MTDESFVLAVVRRASRWDGPEVTSNAIIDGAWRGRGLASDETIRVLESLCASGQLRKSASDCYGVV